MRLVPSIPPRGASAPLVVAVLLTLLVACGLPPEEPGAPEVPRPPGWSDATHGPRRLPAYDLALPQGRVARFDLAIAPADWAAMQADTTQLFGKFGAGGFSLPRDGVDFTPRRPLYVPATLKVDGETWTNVGVRYRGNYSLAQGWRDGRGKISVNLDFDELEDRVPAIENQRFHGIKALALLSNNGDPSYLRQKVAADLFREAGVPAPRTAFVRLFVDFGAGPTYFGLFTAAEVPAKPFLAAAFGEDEGNLYKPEGAGAKFGAGAFDEKAFEKKTNEKAGEFSDVQAVLAALHAPRADAATWRAGLDKVLDADGFLRWLAVNTAIRNWDTYGVLPHNFYVYGGKDGRLRWIVWDLSMAFSDGVLFWQPPSLGLREVSGSWPLIRFLMDDPTYRATYQRHLRAFAEGPFVPGSFVARLRREHALVAPYVLGPQGERAPYTTLARAADFGAELETLVKYAGTRHTAILEALEDAR
jgi:hypothetical protein